MKERDLLPKNMMKVPEVYSPYCPSSYKEGEEEGRGRGEKGERRGGGGGKGQSCEGGKG